MRNCWLPYGGGSTGIWNETQLLDLYNANVKKFSLPPEAQWQAHLAILLPQLRGAGYSDAEIKWWLARTGQGPRCFKQYKIGVGGIPPYDVWRDWYFCMDNQWGIGIQALLPMYPPPGYIMPPFTTPGDGSVFNWQTWQMNQPLPGGLTFDVSGFVWDLTWSAMDAFPKGTPAFCYDGTEGMLHAVPLAWEILDQRVIEGQRFVRGLPIAVMRMLDDKSGGAWWTYFDQQVHAYLASPSMMFAWPYALRDTLNKFGISDAGVWGLQQKMEQLATKLSTPPPKAKFVNMMGDDAIAQIITMVAMSAITMGIGAAIGVAVSAAVDAMAAAEASAVASQVGVEVGIESSLATQGLTGADLMNVAKMAQTAYKVIGQIQSDNPNLLGILGGVTSIANGLGAGDLFTDLTSGWNPAGGGIDFGGSWGDDTFGVDFGTELAALDFQQAAPITGGLLNELATESTGGAWDYAGFDNIVWDEYASATDALVANLSQYADDPDGMLQAIYDYADQANANIADEMGAALDDFTAVDLDDATAGVFSSDAALAQSLDFGNGTASTLDTSMLEDGWTNDATYEGISAGVDSTIANLSLPELSLGQVSQLLNAAAGIAAMTQQNSPPLTQPKPPPAPPPVTQTVVTAAPAPEVTMDVPTTPLLPGDYLEPPAPSIEDAGVVQASLASGLAGVSNWLWALLVGVAIVLPEEKKRRVRRRRKGRK